MITADQFMDEASARGLDFYTGVPCSYLTPLINGVSSSRALTYVGAASEGEAVAIAAGAWLAGRNTVVMCQNSGLGNAVNPLTSLNAPFRIPTLLVTTWRAEPGVPDEPQHEVMGRITPDLLSLMGVPHALFPREPDQVAERLDAAVQSMELSGVPYALIMRKGDVADAALDQPPLPRFGAGLRAKLPVPRTPPFPSSRAAVLQSLLSLVNAETAVIATTGKCGRELFTLADRPQHLYQVGSMGGALGMGLGVALNTDKRVVVLDGDGAALMKLGTMATVGAYRPKNLIHILLDNGVHDSTGGQATVSASVDFAGVALACGYAWAASCRNVEEFEAAFHYAKISGPSLIHVRIQPGSMEKLGRPTVAPHEVARRFKDFLAAPSPPGPPKAQAAPPLAEAG